MCGKDGFIAGVVKWGFRGYWVQVYGMDGSRISDNNRRCADVLGLGVLVGYKHDFQKGSYGNWNPPNIGLDSEALFHVFNMDTDRLKSTGSLIPRQESIILKVTYCPCIKLGCIVLAMLLW